MHTAFVNSFLLVYATLFPIVNPVGSAPLFLGLTQFSTDRERAKLARGVAFNSFFLLLGSLFVGSYVLEFFGISLPVVRIAGGLVVTVFGWKLLNAENRPAGGNAPPEEGGVEAVDAFYPLTMPLTVGPGSISVAIALGSQRPKAADIAHLVQLGGAAIAGIAAIVLTVYLSYRFAERTISFVGRTGTGVVVRLSAFIMMCIGIQILWGGWTALNG